MRAEQRNSEYVAQLKVHPHPWGVALKTVDTQGQRKVFFVTCCCSFKSGHTKVEKSVALLKVDTQRQKKVKL